MFEKLKLSIKQKYNEYYLRHIIDKKQSLGYQMMLIFMNEHQLARNEINDFGTTLGDDKLTFTAENFKGMALKTLNFISKNHSKRIMASAIDEDDLIKKIKELIIKTLLAIDSNYCVLNKDNSEYVFIMCQEGYRYQYNGYKRPDLKLMGKANLFISLTLVYYIIDFLFKDLEINLIEKLEYIIPMIVLSILIFLFKNYHIMLKIPMIIAIIFLVVA
ncbi:MULTISPECIES: hypothetical protein [Psychrilyobacter]|uniref:Uncharacterized protein n=1 Tax=Psychrilyobacter piezotolerans TaxID=2293438 RepID=A0ABX9KIC8_9FUSO|nr:MULTISPECIES: hypothetical protein [Psychrilyobacter]MCS5420294.1 hypothetical protein [Psychrilyobacter sp. S5]NDI77320.1 hypothetical protein [Psychrilyobacter piezotolerans]RDE63370.1 hypothetical protein DV867_05725 [Psychrilyobacter sp. S5]REI41912.1 hypothetical protein DYH56_05725 [Psychrilyobacter piezotolerans]